MDGTLWDSRASIIENWNEVMRRYNLLEKPLLPDNMIPYMGLLATDVLKELCPGISEETLNEVLNEIVKNEAKLIRRHGGILYEKVQETLTNLSQNHELYIVSNAQNGYIEAFLDYYGFHNLFKDFESHGRTKKDKADNIRLILNRNKLNPAETVYVGDTQTDYDSAVKNNLDFIFCNYGFGEITESAENHTINHFYELIEP